jgi:hypothetical protein
LRHYCTSSLLALHPFQRTVIMAINGRFGFHSMVLLLFLRLTPGQVLRVHCCSPGRSPPVASPANHHGLACPLQLLIEQNTVAACRPSRRSQEPQRRQSLSASRRPIAGAPSRREARAPLPEAEHRRRPADSS